MRQPAFSGITPSRIEWEVASQLQINFIRSLTRFPYFSRLYSRSKTDAEVLEGFYKMMIDERQYFLKVVPSRFASSLIEGENIASWLIQNSLSSVASISGFPVHDTTSNLSIFVYPFHNFRYFHPNTHDLFQIGSYVANMHKALAVYPQAKNVQLSSLPYHESLLLTFRKFKHSAHLYSGQIGTACEILLSIDDNLFDSVFHSPQLIHGDLNAGNLLFDVDTSSVFALDFEESIFTFYSCWYDLIFIVQRFIFAHSGLDYYELIKSLLSGYRLVKPMPPLPFEGSLLATLKFISIRSILVLLSSVSSFQPSNSFNAEMKKFIDLYSNSFLFADLLGSIELELL